MIIAMGHDVLPSQFGRMAVIGRKAQVAVELEARVTDIDQQFAKSTVVDLPSTVMPLERLIGKLFEQRGEFDVIPALACNNDIGAVDLRAI